MKKLLVASFSALALFVSASPAASAVRRLTFNGYVDSGVDNADQFGVGGGSLAGRSYVTSYIYKTTLGERLTSPTEDLLVGGEIYSLRSPILSASVTINGITKSINPSFYAIVDLNHSSPCYCIVVLGQQVLPDSSSFYISDSVILDSSMITSLDDTFLSRSVTPLMNELGNEFEFIFYDLNGLSKLTYGELRATSVSIEAVAGYVPEPGQWALLGGGFALTGLAMRRGPGNTARRAKNA